MLIQALKISYKNLMSAKLRSFLSILGIVIGTASVIVIFTLGKSAQALILEQIQGVGSNLIGVLPGNSDEEGPPAMAFGIIVTTLTEGDLKALTNQKNIPEVEVGAGYVSGTQVISNKQGRSFAKSFMGVSADYLKVESGEVERGRFFTEEEEKKLSRTVVLGKNIAKDFFKEEDPIGKKLEIKGQNFTVIGVLKKRGTVGFGMAGQDDSIYLPLKTAQKNLLGIDHLSFIRLKVKDASLIKQAKEKVQNVLRDRHNIKDQQSDDFSVRDQASALQIIEKITDVLRYFLLAIGGVSLLVGGVGIMNIMLIAVHQRVREVGLKKAVGATNQDVLWQFLLESVAVAFLGGIAGIILGFLISLMLYFVLKFAFNYQGSFIFSFTSLIISASISMLIGVIFGVYPARKASKISPIEALRYE